MTNIRRYDATNRPVFMTAVCHQRKTHLKGDGDKKLLLSVMREIKDEKPFTMLGYVILDDHFHWMIQLPGRMSGNPQKAGDTLTYDEESPPAFRDSLTTAGTPKKRNKPDLSGSRCRANLTYDATANHDPACRSGCDRKELPDDGSDSFGIDGSATAHCTNRSIPDNVMPPNDYSAARYTISEIMQSVKLRFTHRYKKLHGINGNVSLWQRRFWDHIARDQEDVNRHLDYIHYNPVKHGHAPKPLDYPFSSFPKYMERGIYPPDWGTTEEPAHLADIKWE